MAEQITERFSRLKKQALDKYFSRMNDMQKRAVFHMDGPLLILAGAGSGKTTVLIGRIENMVRFGRAYSSTYMPPETGEAELAALERYINDDSTDISDISAIVADYPVKPWNTLAITFTNKAAGELKTRLEERLGAAAADIHASTFHSLCVRILRRDIQAIGYERNFTIYDTDDSIRVIKDGLRELKIDEKMLSARTALSYISRAKDTMQTPGEMAEASKTDYKLANVAGVYDYYQKTLKSANALDFDDIIVNTVRLFLANPDVLEYYQNRFRYIMVDEYQDTNQTQYKLISLLAEKHGNLCVVGDDDQSIYKFRGATIENILSFEKQFKNSTVIRLEQNYRSTGNILDAANAIIANNSMRKGKNLWTSSDSGDKIRLVRVRDETEESRYISDSIHSWVKDGGKYSDNAVLYRLNAQSNTLEKALAGSAVPYRIVSGVRFYERKEIKDIVAYLNVLDNPGDALRLTRIINEPKRGIGDSTLQAAKEISAALGESLFDVICKADEFAALSRKSASLMEFGKMMLELSEYNDENGLEGLLDELLERSGYLMHLEAQGLEGRTRIENVMELKSNVLRYAASAAEPSLSGFLEEIALYSDIDNYDADADAVVLMTVHAAKGLEFGNVFIAGMDEGLFPGRMAVMNPSEMEEERRLAYVAVTRAKRRISIISAERRMIFGQTVWNRPSRFTGEISKELIEIEDKTTPTKQKAPRLASAVVGRRSSKSIGIGADNQSKSTPDAGFAKGDTVVHKVFGEGQVLLAKPVGGDTLLEIDFGDKGIKRIMSNFTRLVKV